MRGPSVRAGLALSARLGMTEGAQHNFPMRKFYTLLSREVSSYFYSPIAYIVLIFPLITMRLFAEEFKLGTIEPLMTAPVRDWQVVLAKFFGAVLFYLVLWVPTILYFLIFQYITGQTAAGSSGAYWGSYLMLLLLGMFYVSVGCFASVLTRNQIIAAVISFCAITMHFFSGLITFILTEVSSTTRQLLGYFSALEQMGTLSRGEIDTRPIVLYLRLTIVMLGLTYQAFQSRKWRLYPWQRNQRKLMASRSGSTSSFRLACSSS